MPPPIFKENDLVWIQAPPTLNIEDCSKLAPCKYGPYKIIDVLNNNNNYKIDIKRSPFSKHHPVFYVSELEPFIPTPQKFLKRRTHDEFIKDIIEISGFRSNYKK